MLILPGSGYLLLATNTGARLGFMLAFAGFTGFMVIIGTVWWVYGIGPKGPSPIWESEVVAVGDLANSNAETLQGFPEGWKSVEPTDPAVADAQPVVDGALTGGEGGGGPFKASSEYVVTAAHEKGGETSGPLGLDFRPFDVFHAAHYLAVEVRPVVHQDEGRRSARAQAGTGSEQGHGDGGDGPQPGLQAAEPRAWPRSPRCCCSCSSATSSTSGTRRPWPSADKVARLCRPVARRSYMAESQMARYRTGRKWPSTFRSWSC